MNDSTDLMPEADRSVRAPLEPQRVFYRFAEITPWARNPRGAELRGIEEFAAQLVADGGIKEDLHVFWLNGVVTLMAGHRRHAAGQVAGFPGAMCKDYGPLTEEAAFLLLLSLQQGNDPFDARELAKAARDAVAMGIPVEALTGAMHRSVETVQLYLDLGTLHGRVQDLVYEDRLTLGTASVLRRVASKEDQLTAATRIVQGALGDGVSMGEGQAIQFIRETYLLPVEWRHAWEVLQVKLKKLYPVAEGYHYVAFEDRAAYVQGNVGLPERDYCRAEEYIDASLLVPGHVSVKWGDLAQQLGVAVDVVCAPNHKDGYERVVMMSAVTDAESFLDEEQRTLRGKKGKLSGGGAVAEGRAAPLSDGLEGGELSGGGVLVEEPDLTEDEEREMIVISEALGALERLIRAGDALCEWVRPFDLGGGSGLSLITDWQMAQMDVRALDQPLLNGPQGPSAMAQPLPTSSQIDEAAVLEVVSRVVDLMAGDPVKAMNDGAWRPGLKLMFEMVSRSGMLPPHVLLEIRGMSESHVVKSRSGLRWTLTLLLAGLAVRAQETEAAADEEALMMALKALGA